MNTYIVNTQELFAPIVI